MTDGALKSGSNTSSMQYPLILIAEPNQLNRKLTCDLLKAKGYKILEVANSRLIIEAARHNKPDLVLISAHWPENQINQILKKFRKDKQLDSIPVVAIAKVLQEAGDFNDYCSDYDKLLLMPISTLSIIRLIESILSKVKKHQLS